MPAAVPEPVDPALRNPIGTHVTVGRGLVAGALTRARELGCETLQVFVGNPRGWALSAGDPREDARFREACAESGTRAFIHSPYLVNPGSPTAATYEKSVETIIHNLRRAAEIGAEGVVVHTGSYVDPSGTSERYDAAMRRVREGLLPVLDAIADDAAPWLLLEPTAGQGRSLCAGVEDLAPYLAALDDHPKAGICLDTCHVFAAGAPLDEPGGVAATVDRIVEIGGPGRLRLVHANDSMDVRGAFRDRHQTIGNGHIGADAFRDLFAHPATAGVPFILETPGSRDPGNADFPLLKRLRAEAAAGGSLVNERRTSRLATLALLAMTATWGSTFFLIKDLTERISALDFLAVRFPIATVALFLIFPRALRTLSADSRRRAAVLGGLYAVAQVMQTVGLAHTAASVSGFITGMYVVCTPLLAALLLGNRIGSVTWFAVALAMAGVGLLTLQPGGVAFGYGETLTLVAAVIYALHIVGLGAWSRPEEAMGMSIVQLAVISAVCLLGAAPNGIELPATGRDWVSVIYMAVFAGALAMAGQTWAQAHLSPTRTAIIMSMEPVFAAFFAVLIGGEDMTARLAVGGLMVLGAMLIVELLPRRRIEAEVTHIAV